MFKIESYITPILISYVEKYIKNLKASDTQVSLWGGDATFHNLDLRLDVLEKELQLPFNLVSGHIHELSIHVPWTKLASEPINITINTIECVLKLQGGENSEPTVKEYPKKKKSIKKPNNENIEAPPGYVQSLINKIVNNITVNCKNLILKYVEEDIVVSVNIKLLTFESANEEWQAAFTETSPIQNIMRKLIKLSDLTVCLDKRNASGKIEVYQEPMLYRCCVEIRLLRSTSPAKKDSTTKLDVYCNNMEFSMTEQQIPMLMRLIMLLLALQQRQLKTNATEVPEVEDESDNDEDSTVPDDSWTGWAWRAASSLLPVDEPDEEEASIHSETHKSQKMNIGLYIDHCSFTFKVSEYTTSKGYYSSRKLKYWPLITLQLNELFVETEAHGVEWFNAKLGISEANLIPQGHCTCGHAEVFEGQPEPTYLKSGSSVGRHKINSLFDPNSPENTFEKRIYTSSVDYHLSVNTEAVLLERTPAFAIDYLYKLDLPEDFDSDRLSQIGTDLEYSNLTEMALCRFVGGPFVVRICSGLIHRMDTLKNVADKYDYQPYSEPPVIPNLNELQPPSTDDFDALSTDIPLRTYQLTLFKPVIEFQLMDHMKFTATKNLLFKKRKNLTWPTCTYTLNYPKITIECECIDAKVINPMYPKRLVYTTCQLPTAPSSMFNACYKKANAKIIGLGSRLIFSNNKHTTILMPSNASIDSKSIIFPKFWINPDIPHNEISIDVESLTLTGTKSKFMTIMHILEKFGTLDAGELKNSIFTTSLLQDASRDGMVVLELFLEGLNFRRVQTISTVTFDAKLALLKAFILEAKKSCGDSCATKFVPDKEDTCFKNDNRFCSEGHMNQNIIISGPELSYKSNESIQDLPLFSATFQYPLDAENHVHPPLFLFNVSEIKVCVDPTFFTWLLYTPRNLNFRSECFFQNESQTSNRRTQQSETSGSIQETLYRSNAPQESVHSSSEPSYRPSPSTQEIDERVKKDSLYDFMLEYYSVWTSFVLFGNIAQCTIYFPTQSLTAVGYQDIQEAVERSLNRESPPEILVMKLPHCSIRSASQRKDLYQFVDRLPVKLPESMWTPKKMSFPWSFSIWDFCCYTLQNDSKLNFLKPLSGNATIGLSVKNRPKEQMPAKISKSDVSDFNDSENKSAQVPSQKSSTELFPIKTIDTISLLGICVHIDNTPIVISICDTQLNTMGNILLALMEVVSQKNVLTKEKPILPDVVTNLPCQKSRSQSPNPFKESTQESLSELTPTNPLQEETDELKVTAWMQWTITRLTFKLYTHDSNARGNFSYLLPPTLKLVFEMEDIMSSLDLQKVYMKFKSKIVTATIQHFKRNGNVWVPGDHLGWILRTQEDIPTTERQEEGGFLSLTVTRAKSGNVHTKWGTAKKNSKLADTKIDTNQNQGGDYRSISEVIITLQPLDLLLSFTTLKHFISIFDPLKIETTPKTTEAVQFRPVEKSCLDNSKLPLAYLECHGLRIIMPVTHMHSSTNLNVLIIDINSVHLAPIADNPICRTPIRPDIYQQAAQARILTIPGSEVEDRQYQLNITALSVNTGIWEEFSQILNKDRSAVSFLHTMNENPALEWNNLGGKLNNAPHLVLLPIIKKFDMCFVAAPAIVYKNALICGSSLEINFVSDMDITLSICQIKLLVFLAKEVLVLSEPIQECRANKNYVFSYVSQYNLQNEPKDDLEIFKDYTRDSGFDTVEVNSEKTLKTKDSDNQKVNSIKIYLEKSSDKSPGCKCSSIPPQPQPQPQTQTFILNYCPMDILIAGGQISVCLYKIKNFNPRAKYLNKTHKQKSEPTPQERGYEASEEGSVDEKNLKQEMRPLIFLLFSQPNVFISQLTFGNKLNFSCFDICFKIGGPDYTPTHWIPTQNDFPINILETKSGSPDPDTGIPPAFLTLKYQQSIGKAPTLNVEFERPIKITYCLLHWCHLGRIKEKIIRTLNKAYPKKDQSVQTEKIDIKKPQENYTKHQKIKNILFGLHSFNIKLAQFVFEIKTELGPELTFSIGKIKSSLMIINRPERVVKTFNLENVTITTNNNGSKKLLLNPWSCNFEVSLFWESWQSANSDPQVQLSIDSDCFIVDIGPEQLKTLECVVKDYNELLTCFNLTEKTPKEEDYVSTDRDQHYKDDLRAGAFQFVEATGKEDELPLPYQVMFWSENVCAMAWRYPQPRVLTKVRVFPVPFKITQDSSKDQQILCNLEYWSECHGKYLPYTQFYLSESEVAQLELPLECPRPAISCCWRVILTMIKYNEKIRDGCKVCVSPRALAACMRIDSYFNPILVPGVQIAMKLSLFSIQLYNQVRSDGPVSMPKCLQGYVADGLNPNNQCFLNFAIENCNLSMSKWIYDTLMLDFVASIHCNVLDYSCLTQEPFILPFFVKFVVNISDTLTVSVLSKTINMKFSPSIGHTLAVSSQIWNQMFVKNFVDVPELVISTRYVICNNTNLNLRFGQTGTEEDILLPSKYLHMYAWRSQKFNQKISVGLEENGWVWSDPIDIDTIRKEVIEIKSESKILTIILRVVSLSDTQKQISFSGQLIICNMLLEHFELKLLSAGCSTSKDAEFKSAPSHIVSGKSQSPTLVENLDRKLCLRIRFYGLESAWSGDIPLEENCKCSQPWLVKVPLQERGQFLSIWCRVVDQTYEKDKQKLVLLWPLFMVRSNLPVNAEVRIETPVLNVNVETVIRGRGELQQLYCPGTIDHSHQLTFQLDSETLVSNPYVPLNYSLVDQKVFFKKFEYQNVEEVLTTLSNIGAPTWPYVEHENIDWIADDQPLTHVQVHYQNASEFSNALLVELRPWCLVLNMLGCDVAIIANNGHELCRLRHNGVVTPPKLDSTFQISVGIGDTWNISSVLQLAKPDWSQSFYKPKISGVIPTMGDLTLPIKCDNGLSLTHLTSSIKNDIHILEIASSHILTNHTSLQFQVACLALPNTNAQSSYNIPADINKYSFSLAPNLNSNKVGIPIIHWFTPYELPDSLTEYSLHILFCLERKGNWSCPIRVDKVTTRKSLSISSPTCLNVPLILISQEHKGQVYLSIHHDYNPQLLIENKCSSQFLLAQSNGDTIIKDNPNVNWTCVIHPNSAVYYTLPTLGEKFPDLVTQGSETIVLSTPMGTPEIIWSQPVDIHNLNEQYLRIPHYGDVKLIISKKIYTTLIQIVSITEIEISAGDIRSRLLYHENQMKFSDNQDEGEKEPDGKTVHFKRDRGSEITIRSIYYSSTDVSRTDETCPTRCKGEESKSTTKVCRANWSELRARCFNDNCYNPRDQNLCILSVFVESFIFQLISDAEESGFERSEIAVVFCENFTLNCYKNEGYFINLSISDIQFDNQLFTKNSFDFPVVFVRQDPIPNIRVKNLCKPIGELIKAARKDALLLLDLQIAQWVDPVTNRSLKQVTDIKVSVQPILVFIEDKYLLRLKDVLGNLSPAKLVIWPKVTPNSNFNLNSTLSLVNIPESLTWEIESLAHPLLLRSLTIEPIAILISLHTSVKVFISLDRSPLQFNMFERKNILTTSYRLGHVLTMHYLSGAIFSTGWVIGSIELFGNPGGLARSVGSGLRDFISLPYYGLIQGPWAFLVGISHGSASLIRHITAGTLYSVTKLASSVARNLDRLTMDQEHLQRTEELRRHRPQGVGQGIIQGLSTFGISLLGAIGGIAHHPLQSVIRDGASPRGLVTGVGLGLVGVVTKPLSGAAEFVALTGQGLLQGAGWNPIPEARALPTTYHSFSSNNAVLKYKWKFLHNANYESSLFAATEATLITCMSEYVAVSLILTVEALIIFNSDEDIPQRIILLNEIVNVDIASDPTLICFYLKPPVRTLGENDPPEMDPACRERVANYVRNSASLMHLPSRDSSPVQSDLDISPIGSFPNSPVRNTSDSPKLTFYVNPQFRNHFYNLLIFAKQQSQDSSFKTL